MRVEELDYDLPRDRIANRPLAERDASRLLVVGAGIAHHSFRDLPEVLPEGALVVLNDARVVPARLCGRRVPGGGRVEILCVRPRGDAWLCLARASKPLRPGTVIDIAGSRSGMREGARATVRGRREDELLEVTFDGAEVADLMRRVGHTPLPPYLRREDDEADREQYQTVFAERPGAVAAPTAGLHFTRALLDRLRARFTVATLTLTVGPGTFVPPRGDDARAWRVPPELYEIPEATVAAVGTTVVRALETCARTGRAAGETDLVLLPGDPFRVVDALLTNFHLPRTTLLALAFAFAGRERVLAAYRVALAARYRFLSYGDATLLWPLRPTA